MDLCAAILKVLKYSEKKKNKQEWEVGILKEKIQNNTKKRGGGGTHNLTCVVKNGKPF